MSPLSRLSSRAKSLGRNLFSNARVERDLDEEVRAYADLLLAEKMRAGMTAEDARRAALVEVGGIERVKDDVRAVRSGALLETTAQDVRYSIRTLMRRPSFTIVASSESGPKSPSCGTPIARCTAITFSRSRAIARSYS